MTHLLSSLDHPTVQRDQYGRPRRPLRGERNQCSGCGEFFNSNSAFSKHRIVGLCMSPDEMRSEGMALNGDGFWVTSTWAPEAIAALVQKASA